MWTANFHEARPRSSTPSALRRTVLNPCSEEAILRPSSEGGVTIEKRRIDLLDAGHRAADAVVRFSSKRDVLQKAFRAIAETGDAHALAELAPTSLVFGPGLARHAGQNPAGDRIHDSRLPYPRLDRAAQFFSALEKAETEAFNYSQVSYPSRGSRTLRRPDQAAWWRNESFASN